MPEPHFVVCVPGHVDVVTEDVTCLDLPNDDGRTDDIVQKVGSHQGCGEMRNANINKDWFRDLKKAYLKKL